MILPTQLAARDAAEGFRTEMERFALEGDKSDPKPPVDYFNSKTPEEAVVIYIGLLDLHRAYAELLNIFPILAGSRMEKDKEFRREFIASTLNFALSDDKDI